VNQQPLRILVVPMQTGRDHRHVTMEQRAAQVASAKPLSARPMPRTTHMDGTALALKVLLGLPLGNDDEIEPGVHLFDCFAMANATLCSHIASESASGAGTPEMHDLCVKHLRRTIEILQPTVILSQGWRRTGPSPATSVARALGIAKPERGTCTSVKLGYGAVAFAAVIHPARNWPAPGRPKFRSEVLPVLREARRLAVG